MQHISTIILIKYPISFKWQYESFHENNSKKCYNLNTSLDYNDVMKIQGGCLNENINSR